MTSCSGTTYTVPSSKMFTTLQGSTSGVNFTWTERLPELLAAIAADVERCGETLDELQSSAAE